jgi:hypothetical protein
MVGLTVVLLAVANVERDNPLVAPSLSYNSSSRNGAAAVVDDEKVGGEEDTSVVE